MTDAPDTDAETRDYRETLFLPETDFPMRAGLPKAEPEHLRRWEKADVYARLREDAKGRPTFVLHDGPPYANGHLHIGHALNKILKDFIVRTRQMMGYDAPYIPGWDCHGLPIEWKVEEAFRQKGRKKDDVPAAEFRRACREYAQQWVDIQREEFKRLGIFGDWEEPYLTMDFGSEAAIVGEFLKFAETGQLFRGSKPVMWSPVEQTALAEAEVEYADHQSHTIWVKFPVEGEDVSVVIWTTTPWTIPGNRAVAFNTAIQYGVYEVTAVEKVVDPKTGEEKDPWSKPGDKIVIADRLAEDVRVNAKIAEWSRLADYDPSGKTARHPFEGLADAGGYWDFVVPLIDGDHVTDEAGTGFVHTAPSHGQEDYDVWMAHGLGQENIPDMVDETGAYVSSVPVFTGMEVIRTSGKKTGQDGPANTEVIKKLVETGALLARGRLKHSYPHSWRSKAPLIYRNTPQWFIHMDTPAGGAGPSLRQKALKAIEETSWHPPQAINRIRSMVADRPDWLISRQRNWGVPLTLFVHAETGEVLPRPGFDRNSALRARITDAVKEGGADAWFEKSVADFLDGLVDDPDAWEKVEDILDVWFDSGSTHSFCLEDRGLPWPADVYLEGSDQHRGWFQSSLLEGSGTRGRAPFKGVVTHGFTLDEEGRKMSKALGNTVGPAEVTQQFGAEILRLWVATSDYAHDQRIGQSIIKSNADAYRKLRNTIRYLLGALDGFTEADRVDLKDAPGLERWVLHRLAELDETVRAAYEAYDFKGAFDALFLFCTNDLSAFYLDVRKDALYCDPLASPRRQACRTVMDLVFERLTAWLAPIMVFTMEEAWLSRFPDSATVHLRQFPGTPADWKDEALAARWAQIRTARRVVTAALELERREKRIGSSLEAAVAIYLSAEDEAVWRAEAEMAGDDLATFTADICITSGAELLTGDAPSDAFRSDEAAGVAVVPGKANGRKCARSWKYFDPETADARYPDVTPRDAIAVAEWDKAHG